MVERAITTSQGRWEDKEAKGIWFFILQIFVEHLLWARPWGLGSKLCINKVCSGALLSHHASRDYRQGGRWAWNQYVAMQSPVVRNTAAGQSSVRENIAGDIGGLSETVTQAQTPRHLLGQARREKQYRWGSWARNKLGEFTEPEDKLARGQRAGGRAGGIGDESIPSLQGQGDGPWGAFQGQWEDVGGSSQGRGSAAQRIREQAQATRFKSWLPTSWHVPWGSPLLLSKEARSASGTVCEV